MIRISRPRLWLAVSLAALSLMVVVTLRTQFGVAQDKPPAQSETLQWSDDPFDEEPSRKEVGATKAKSSKQRMTNILIQNEVVLLPKEVVESQNVITGRGQRGETVTIGRSRNLDLLFGYSRSLRKWIKQPTAIPKTNSVPTIGDFVAVVKLDLADKPEKLTFFAFSALVGRWDSIEVSTDASAPTIHNNTIVVTDGETTHVFKGEPGEWTTPMAEVADNEARKLNADDSLLGAQGGGGFGGGGFGGASGGFLGGGSQAGGGKSGVQLSQSTIMFADDVIAIPKEAIGSQQLVVGGKLAIIASNKHDMLWGYSVPLGKWVKQPVSLEVEGLVPVVGGSVAAVIPAYKTKPERKTYFGFSSATGRWASLDVSLNASDPSVSATMVIVNDGEATHVFKNDTGKWSTPTAAVVDNEAATGRTKSEAAPPLPYIPPYLRYSDDLEVYLVVPEKAV